MSPNTTCERCGAHLATSGPTAGQCPKCLLEAGMGEGGLFVVSGGATATAPEPQELAEHFPELDIVELLGQGGMGTVYRVIERELGRASALKIMTSESAQRPGFVERFQREARAMASLSHPNLLTLYRFGQAGPHCFLLTELVEGADLRQLIRERRLAPRQALSIVGQLCDALQYAHDQGVVHRDIKPENVLVDRRGQIKVLDFGLAKLTEQDSPGLTLTGQAMGTPHYMAPEQWESPLEVDHRADLYSLGVVLYELLTGELPVGRFPLPSDRVEVDVRLDEVVLRALEKEPDRRYQAASEIGTAVSKVAEAEQPMRHAPRNRSSSDDSNFIGTLTAGVLLALILGGAGAMAWLWYERYQYAEHRQEELAALTALEHEAHAQASGAAQATEELELDADVPGAPLAAEQPPGTPLVLAASQGNLPGVQQWLLSGADVNYVEDEGGAVTGPRFALGGAAAGGHAEVVEALLEAGAIPGLTDGNSRALGIACRSGDPVIAALLLDAGARADMRDAEGTPFVVLAAEQTSHETLEVLLSKTTDPSTGRTRLDLEMFDEDVPRGDGGRVKKGYAALATAIMAGCEQSVRLLMNHGADLSKGVYGEAALCSVLRAEMRGLVDDFLEREPDLSRGKELYLVYSDPEDRVLLERLLDAGAPIDAAPNGWTILQSAVTGEDTELVRFLLERGADPTLQTQSSPSAIEIATEEDLTDILGLLQQAAEGPNATSEAPAWDLKLPTAQACEPIMRAPSPTPRADARSTEDEWQPERRRPGHWVPIVHINLVGEVVQSGDSVYDFEDPNPAEFARLQQRLVDMARRMTPEFNEALQVDLPDDALVIRADERTPFAYVSHLMEACARPEVRIWKLEFAVQRAVLGDETPQECRISVHLPIDSGEPSFELRVSADVLVEGRPRRDSERSQDGEDPDESQERIIRYDVDGLRTQDIEKARLFIQAAGAQERDGPPRATLHLSPGVLHGEVIALLDELSSAGFEDFAFVANDPGRSGR